MKTVTFLTIVFGILGMTNLYSFLFQRTVRKIRMFAFGSEMREVEKMLYPSWVLILYYISFLRFIPLVWVFILNWKLGILIYGFMWLLIIIIPVNDYGHIQIIKRTLGRRINSHDNIEFNSSLLDLVLLAEKETLK